MSSSAGTYVSHGPELLTFVGVVGVEVAVHAVPTALGRFRLIPSSLRIWLCREHDSPLALHFLGLGLLVFWVGIWKLEEVKASLLSSRALGRHIEHLQSRARVLMYSELLLHLDITDAIGECRDDGLVYYLGDLEANTVEMLDVLL